MSDHASPRLVWSPYPLPAHPEKAGDLPPGEDIIIKHPGYEQPLLTFLALDAGGVHHQTARVACAILDDNQWDGILTWDRAGEQAVPASDTILRPGIYYFQTSRRTESNYALTPNFEHWRFPHGNLPPSWREIASFKQDSRPDPDLCRITQFEDGVEDAHLIPSAERQWFNDNNMATYIKTTRLDKMKGPGNIIRLRSDIHTVFDAKRFAIVPIEGRLVVFCLNTSVTSQVARLYHGVELHQIRDSGRLGQFLLARFAYTVFECLRDFLEANNVARKLRLRVDNETQVEWSDPECCWRFAQVTARQGKSRSASPRKRPHPDAGPMESDDDGSEPFRGRKRRRSDETETSSNSSRSDSTSSTDLSVKSDEAPSFPGRKIGNTTGNVNEVEGDGHGLSS